ncbi:CRISPR-associated protein Csx19 [Bariatricus massiliensis]|uniref:CRISPR-associated protein Csx19 n=1 Tax=Bariatricus massiliensis TaxID=1745713 RepID=A0ABS8DHM5_9FIRM|nr:CRISPR-associated protein Csx19 [Bariatricus massiliensis]MCB7304921.1 CRISPR-associated protein Csx19 [Bariatricus massiliensis]MCB7375475.1 CRISPR-associated protein Csx19 [Bariatricus massiliensis]MCB7387935.1 CRISPR-associated protein Csx19 [Bariatricus massiliensis]MCB7412245.1 CRISPR-associated protein Csx19 [Bariatricus massiliensis]MCQ5253330.1 CRISPR-associated protein Csx19 [Bariatricus massiliensis]
MNVQKDNVGEGYKKIESTSEAEIKETVKKYFPNGANLYVVLDYAVGFGKYQNGEFYVGLGNHTALEPLPWEYTRELRIFDEAVELWLKPAGDKWKGRFRGSSDRIHAVGETEITDGLKSDEETEYYMDEKQKLWGEVRKENQGGISGWSLLTSGRGTQIQIPMKLQKPKNHEVCNRVGAAIEVRRYMRIPNAENQELVYQTDIRMKGFCQWEHERWIGGIK